MHRALFWCLALLLVAVCCTPKEEENAQLSEEEKFVPQVRYGLLVNSYCEEEGVIRTNQQFTDMFGDHPVSMKAMRQLNTIPRSTFDFRSVRAGNRFSLFTHGISDSVQALVLVHDPVHYTIFHMADSLRVERCTNPVDTLIRSTAGTITTSLYETIEELGISHSLTNRFVDIFAWKVDFYYLHGGETFRILYEELSVNGQPFGIGDILGIQFNHGGKDDYAIPYDQGEGTEYYGQDGLSLRKAMLKYPIEFTRISSRYSPNRFHPILKINRPHLGTDLVAPAGTPIRSAGDGTVSEAGHKGGNGNYVLVRHNGTYTTGYLHMSRIASGIRSGVRVRQGEVIGYVGQTGWATGPHLCYRFWKNGTQVDPLREELPSAEPIQAANRDRFKQLTDSLKSKLVAIPVPAAKAAVH